MGYGKGHDDENQRKTDHPDRAGADARISYTRISCRFTMRDGHPKSLFGAPVHRGLPVTPDIVTNGGKDSGFQRWLATVNK